MNSTPSTTTNILWRAGCPLHYWLTGPEDRPMVGLIHGMTMDHTMFDLQVEALAAEYRVLTMDLRGHGLSQPLGDDFSIPLLVDDLLAILDQIGARQVALVGHSMGGMVAQELVFRQPERVSALVAYGIPCITLPTSRLQALRRPIAPLARVLLRLVPYHPIMHRTATRMAQRPEVQAQIRTMMDQVTPAVFRRIVTALPAGRHAEPGYHVPCSLLIMRGEHDPYADGAAAVAAWAARDSHAITATIRGAGHNANQDCPQAFNTTLLDFLRRVVPAEIGRTTG
jgi:3-oxoadipate enol-lactonase